MHVNCVTENNSSRYYCAFTRTFNNSEWKVKSVVANSEPPHLISSTFYPASHYSRYYYSDTSHFTCCKIETRQCLEGNNVISPQESHQSLKIIICTLSDRVHPNDSTMWLCIIKDSLFLYPTCPPQQLCEHWYQHGCLLLTYKARATSPYLFKEASPYHSVLSLTSGVTFYDLSNPLNFSQCNDHLSPHYRQPQAIRCGHITTITHNKILWFLSGNRGVDISLCFRVCSSLSNICRCINEN